MNKMTSVISKTSRKSRRLQKHAIESVSDHDVKECVLLRCARKSDHTQSVVVHYRNLQDYVTLEGLKPVASSRNKIGLLPTSVITRCHLPLEKSRTQLHSPDDLASIQIYVKPLIVLDLNGILCRRVRGDSRDLIHLLFGSQQGPEGHIQTMNETGHYRKEGSDKEIKKRVYRTATAFVARTPVIERTDLASFLSLLDRRFTVAVWTSAKLKTAKLLVKALFPTDIARRLLFIWGQDRCERINHNEALLQSPSTENDIINAKEDTANALSNQFLRETIFIKSLAKVWNEFPLWDSSNTILLDDSPEKCPRKHSKNTLHPPPILGFDSLLIDHVLKSSLNHANLMTDEVNQERQADFFEKLSHVWIDPLSTADSNNENLYKFLSEFGRGHMGWRH